jgi:hypothetical protein
MFGKKFKIPGDLDARLATQAEKYDFKSAQEFAEHLVDRRLEQYGIPDSIKKFKKQLDYVVEEHGYSDRDEVIEHLLERGLRAYEEPAESREDLEARLRGLGYIE